MVQPMPSQSVAGLLFMAFLPSLAIAVATAVPDVRLVQHPPDLRAVVRAELLDLDHVRHQPASRAVEHQIHQPAHQAGARRLSADPRRPDRPPRHLVPIDQPFVLHQLEHRGHGRRGHRPAAPQGGADLLQLRRSLFPERLQDLQLTVRRLRSRRPGHRGGLRLTNMIDHSKPLARILSN